MYKFSFVFPGQGSQFTGMGKNLFNNFEVAKRTYEEANEILGFDLANLCFDGSLAELAKSENSFVAILTTSIATYRVYMKEIGIPPQFCAGHSLGEYSALTCAGAINFDDAVRLVYKRATMSQQLVDSIPCGMTIIDFIDKNVVAEICKEVSKTDNIVSISCFNSPKQVAVSGHNGALWELEDKIHDLGGQITPLINSAPFHSVLMSDVALEFKELLKKCTFNHFRYPVIANSTAKPINDTKQLMDLLTKQLTSPVQWQKTMEYMKDKGTNKIIELGPKNLLANLVSENLGEFDSICYGVKKERSELQKYVNSNNKLSEYIPTILTKCLSAAVSTPNENFEETEYMKGVIEQYRELKKIKDDIESNGATIADQDIRKALLILKSIFETKKISVEEQNEWFTDILEETGLWYEYRDFCIHKE